MATFKGNNHSIDYQVQAFAKARFCASFFFFFKDNDNNNRNNFKQMKKKKKNNNTYNRGPVCIWPSCWWEAKPEFTHSLTHSLTTRFRYKDVWAYKISIVIYHKIFTFISSIHL